MDYPIGSYVALGEFHFIPLVPDLEFQPPGIQLELYLLSALFALVWISGGEPKISLSQLSLEL